LQAFLHRHRRVALDTSIFIYQLEGNHRYLPFTDQIFSWLEHPGAQAVTSTITLTELLVQPYRDSDQQRIDAYNGLLTTHPQIEWIAPNLDIADLAARFRALYKLKTPDAIQSATAAQAHVSCLITNDPIFKRVNAFEVLVMDHLL
jgi:predicted nucleic acid-binding protein